jgi:serine/threonine protein kinase
MGKRLTEMLRALSDGQPLDWDAADQGSERRRRRVRTLRGLARVISAHRTVQPLRVATSIQDASAAAGVSEESALGTWGSYVLVEHLGAGTSADVFRAYDPRLDRDLALKLLTPFHSGRDRGDAVIAEGRNLARVRHPNVATVFAAERLGGRVGIAMELVRGDSIEQTLATKGVFDAAATVATGLQLCAALEAVHEAGLVHRDVKAQNVIREPGGRLVLTDFGTAVDHSGAPAAVMAGTPAYTAPEVFLGHDFSVRSDLYSLGVLLFRMLTGAFPVEGDTITVLRQSLRDQRQQRLADLRHDVPDALADVIAKALAYDPSDRFANAGSMHQALQRTLAANSHEQRQRVTSRWRAVAAAALMLTATLAGVLWSLRSADIGGTQGQATSGVPAFPSDSWVLVSQFTNATGDPQLGAAVTYAVERELARSRHVNVIPPERVEDALRMMKQPLDAALDEELAREVSERDGAVRVIVAGRVGKFGSRFVVDARLLDPPTARVFATATADAATADDLAGASRTVAQRVRELLGEAPALVRDTQPLERATTPSLNALRLYSESYRMGRRRQWPGALELVQQAVAADPEFATAHIWLAWALWNTKAPSHIYLAAAERAVAQASSVDDKERFWIMGSYYYMVGDEKRAEGAYQALLQLDPGHVWALGNLTQMYQRQDREREALPYALRAAELRPNDAFADFGLAHRLATLLGDFDQARPYVNRFKAASPREWPAQLAWAYYFDAAERLAQRDVSGATAHVMSILNDLEDAPEWMRDHLVAKAVRYFLATGQARHALAALDRFADRQFFYAYYRAYTAFALEDWRTARDYISDVPLNYLVASAVWLMARLGFPDDAEQWLEKRQTNRQEIDRVVGGSIRFAQGDVRGSIPMLEATRALKVPGNHARATRDLADALLKQARTDRAIRLLREAFYFDRDADKNADGPYGHEWMPNAMLLAELCFQSKCRTEAEAVLKDLTALLVLADDDFPLRVRLDKLKNE